MHVFTRRNAVIGWLATRIVRKRLERRLNAAAGNLTSSRRRLALGTAVAAVGAVVVVTRHVAGTDARAA